MPARRPYSGHVEPNAPIGEPYGPSGISMAWGKANNRMLEGLIPHTGKTLWNGDEQNDYLALNNGSGSVYDNPATGGTRQIAPAWAGVEAGLTRLNNTASVRREGVMRQNQRDAEAAGKLAGNAAYAQQVDAIRNEQAALSTLPPNLRRVYSQLTPTEKADLMGDSPDRRYARLSSHPLLRPQSDYLAPQREPMVPMQMPTIPSYMGPAKPRTTLRSPYAQDAYDY